MTNTLLFLLSKNFLKLKYIGVQSCSKKVSKVTKNQNRINFYPKLYIIFQKLKKPHVKSFKKGLKSDQKMAFLSKKSTFHDQVL